MLTNLSLIWTKDLTDLRETDQHYGECGLLGLSAGRILKYPLTPCMTMRFALVHDVLSAVRISRQFCRNSWQKAGSVDIDGQRVGFLMLAKAGRGFVRMLEW